MINLKNIEPFAKGGNRLCFVHPNDHTKVIKVRRPDFTLEDLRKKKGFPKSLKPLSSFDDNLEEYNVLKQFKKNYGVQAFEHVCKCYGFEDTDLGKGLTLELVRDANGLISFNIKQYLYEIGATDSFRKALAEFNSFWLDIALPSRNLLAHNILVQQDDKNEVRRLVVVDGLGDPSLIPYGLIPKALHKKKAQKRILSLNNRINNYISRIEKGEPPTDIGILLHRGEA